MAKILIVIPARYGSSRLPGKPLVKIKGVEMIKRVAQIADFVCKSNQDAEYVIATDDQKIFDFATKNNLPVVITSKICKNGSERCWDAVKVLQQKPELIINLQGDNPFCPAHVVQSLIDEWNKTKHDISTPFIQLDWESYNNLIEHKGNTKHSGTSVLIDKDNYATTFSKNIVPAIRNIEKAMQQQLSPVRLHIGLYAYSYESLEKYVNLPQSEYEQDYIEGLEQLRFLYNGFCIKMVQVDCEHKQMMLGIDSWEDVELAEKFLT